MPYIDFAVPEPNCVPAKIDKIAKDKSQDGKILARLATLAGGAEPIQSNIGPMDGATDSEHGGTAPAKIDKIAKDPPREQRAGVIERDGDIPREWAEGFAYMLTMRRSTGFGISRWEELLDDAGRFIDTWARQASALGWTTADVFGIHPTLPEARHDMKGLIAVLRGGRVVAMSESGAVIQSPTGARHSFRRLPSDVRPASLWD